MSERAAFYRGVALLAFGAACKKSDETVMRCQGLEGEARAALGQLHASEKAYEASKHGFTMNYAELGYNRGESRHYEVKLTTATATGFTATANGHGEADGASWAIDETGAAKLLAAPKICR